MEDNNPVLPQQPVIEPQPVKKPFFSKAIIAVLVIVLLLIFLPASMFLFLNSNKQVACTIEAKICPDGSSVGRTGPKCEFQACPKTKSASDSIANWKTYEDKEIGISFKYPSDWKKVNNSSTDINLYPPTSVIEKPSPMIDIYSTSAAYETLKQPPMGSVSLITVDNIIGWQSEDHGPLLPHLYTVALPNQTGSLRISTDGSLKTVLREILSTFKFTNQTAQTDPTVNWKTYTSAFEKLSFRYPQTWTLDSIPCVNSITQQQAECAQLHSPKDKNGVPITIYYQYNDPGENYVGGLKVEEIQQINIINSKKSLYLVTASNTNFGTSQVGLYDKQTSSGETIPNLTVVSQVNNSALIKMIGYLQTGVQQPEPYTLTAFKNHPYYNEAINIFKNLSY